MLAPEIKKDRYKDWNIPPAPGPPPATSSSSAKPAEDPAVTALLDALHSNQDGLAPAVQNAMQKVISKSNRTVVNDMYTSVGGLDQATMELEAAVHARNQLHRSWQHFLAASVEEWQGFTQRFKDQEKIMQEHVKKAKANLRNTRKNLDSSKEKLVERAAQVGASAVEISDEENEENKEELKTDKSGQAIMEGLASVTTAL